MDPVSQTKFLLTRLVYCKGNRRSFKAGTGQVKNIIYLFCQQRHVPFHYIAKERMGVFIAANQHTKVDSLYIDRNVRLQYRFIFSAFAEFDFRWTAIATCPQRALGDNRSLINTMRTITLSPHLIDSFWAVSNRYLLLFSGRKREQSIIHNMQSYMRRNSSTKVF